MDIDVSAPAASGPVVCLGEALVDVVIRDGQTLGEHVGGSPFNVACGLARLDHPTTLACWVARDERGEGIIAAAGANGLALAPGSDDADRTSTAQAVLDEQGKATYTFDLTWQLPELTGMDDVAHVHTGSIGATLEPGGQQVIDALKAVHGHASISYDPNARPAIMGSPDEVLGRIEEIISLSTLVKASDEDIAWLHPDVDLDDVLSQWMDMGPSLVVATRGELGARVLLGDGSFHDVPPMKVALVDTVGAGDSFMAGLVSGLLDADLLGGEGAAERLRTANWGQIRSALDRAAATSGITVSRAGAYGPDRGEVAYVLAR